MEKEIKNIYTEGNVKIIDQIVEELAENLNKNTSEESDLWERVVDFTKIKKGGVSGTDLLSCLKISKSKC